MLPHRILFLLCSLLWSSYGSLARAAIGTTQLASRQEVIVAYIQNVRVIYDLTSHVLQLNLDLEAIDPHVILTYIQLDLFIGGQQYTWQLDGAGSCVIDRNLCPLPLYKSAYVHLSGMPNFTLPDDVWSLSDPIGTYLFSGSTSDDAYGESPGELTHVNFVPGGKFGSSGKSTGLSWVSGLATLGLLGAAGIGSLLGGAHAAASAAGGNLGGTSAAAGPGSSAAAGAGQSTAVGPAATVAAPQTAIGSAAPAVAPPTAIGSAAPAVAPPTAIGSAAPAAAPPTVIGSAAPAAAAPTPTGFATTGIEESTVSGSGAELFAAAAAAKGVHSAVTGKPTNAPENPTTTAHATTTHATTTHATTTHGTGPGDEMKTSASADPSSASGGHGPPLSRMDPLTLFLQFQFISTTGFISLNYPPLYRGFTVNFSWANFLLPIRAFKNHATRTHKCQLTGLGGGIALYAIELGVDPQDVFLVAYITFLCVCAIFLGLFLFTHLFIFFKISTAKDVGNEEKWRNRQKRWQQWTSNNSLRLMNLGFGSLITFVFYQWTQKCAAGATIFASITALFFIFASLGLVTFLILRTAKRPGGIEELFVAESIYARRWGSLYNTLKETQLSFVLVLLAVALIRRMIIGFGQKSGLAQNILLILLELAMFIALYKQEPYYSTGFNRVNYLLAGVNVFSLVLSLPFNYQVHLNPKSAWALAIFHILLHGLVVLALFVLTVLKLGWGVLWYRSKHIAFQKRPRLGGRRGVTASSTATETEKE